MDSAPDYQQRFGGVGRLFGRDGLRRLAAARVCVVGVGGVGSWTVEALARSGVGALTLIDLDDVCITNVNRQLPALDGEIGRPKVEVLAERVRAINPACAAEAIPQFFTAGTAAALLEPGYDFVVDAIDKVAHKCLLIVACRERGVPVLTVGGAGGKRDGTAVRVCDLAFSVQDDLLKQVRRRLRQEHGFAREVAAFGVSCVYSPEKPVFPWADGRACEKPEPGSDLTLDCASGFGTATFITGAFGFAAAGEVVRRLTGGNPLSGVPGILPRLHLVGEGKLIARIRLDDLSDELQVNGVIFHHGALIKGLEFEGDEEGPRRLRVEVFAALHHKHFRDFEEVDAGGYHQLLNFGRGHARLKFEEADLVYHERADVVGAGCRRGKRKDVASGGKRGSPAGDLPL